MAIEDLIGDREENILKGSERSRQRLGEKKVIKRAEISRVNLEGWGGGDHGCLAVISLHTCRTAVITWIGLPWRSDLFYVWVEIKT